MASPIDLAVSARTLDRLDRIEKCAASLADPTRLGRVKYLIEAESAALRDRLRSCATHAACMEVDADVARLAGLTIELHGGLAARTSGLDDGLCDRADELLAEVAGRGGPAWAFATIPANADFYGERDFVIRVRWPGNGVWSLPFALHELGHFVGRRLEQRERLDPHRWTIMRPLEDRLRATGEEMPVEWNELHEFFADAYAAYVGGPAFLGACVCEGLDPVNDEVISDSHPAPSRRVALILDLLRRMDERDDNTATICYEIDHWEQRWVEARRRAGRSDRHVPTEADRVLADFCWELLVDRLPNSGFTSMDESRRIMGALRDVRDEDEIASAVCGRRRIEVMNAAWCLRRQLDDVAMTDSFGVRVMAALATAGGTVDDG